MRKVFAEFTWGDIGELPAGLGPSPDWDWNVFWVETFRGLLITVVAFALAVVLAFRIARREQSLLEANRQRDEHDRRNEREQDAYLLFTACAAFQNTMFEEAAYQRNDASRTTWAPLPSDTEDEGNVAASPSFVRSVTQQDHVLVTLITKWPNTTVATLADRIRIEASPLRGFIVQGEVSLEGLLNNFAHFASEFGRMSEEVVQYIEGVTSSLGPVSKAEPPHQPSA